ncbi:MAG: hypothetical protein VX403_07250, partial [Planctomycetota bacterium]|nr:hypothetical protein [Planctomycetota bacterium]
MLQAPIVPAYALVIHKVQALSMPEVVHGCLEGVFAHGQVYVLVSRVTVPENFQLVGFPPADMLDEVAQAWEAAGLDVDACLRAAASVTGDWEYTATSEGRPPATNVRRRLQKKSTDERRVPVKLRNLCEILNPQPRTAEVFQNLLNWIDRADQASQTGGPRPAFLTPEETPIFPTSGEEWWLTEFEQRKRVQAQDQEQDESTEEETDPGSDEGDGKNSADDPEFSSSASEPSDSEPTDPTDPNRPPPQGPPPQRPPPREDPREPTGAGIRNLGHPCYLAAGFRARAMAGEATEHVLQAQPAHTTEARRQTAKLLRDVLPRDAPGPGQT